MKDKSIRQYKANVFLWREMVIGLILLLSQSYSQNLLFSTPDSCTSGFITSIYYDQINCKVHAHCSSGESYYIDSTGQQAVFYSPFPSTNFSHSGMTKGSGQTILILRDINTPAFGPGAELWSINLLGMAPTLIQNLDSLTNWEPWGLAINPLNGNLIIGEVHNLNGTNVQYIIEISLVGQLVDTLVSIRQMDSLGLGSGAGDGALDIDPISGKLIFGAWAGIGANNLYAVDLLTKAINPFYNTSLMSQNGPTGISFSSEGDFVLSTPSRVYWYDRNGDSKITCDNNLLSFSQGLSSVKTQDKSVTIYSNPSIPFIKIKHLPKGPGEITILSSNGKSMHEMKYVKSSLKINTIAFPSGVYFLKWNNGKTLGRTIFTIW
ncbi:MAG: T9SS type A sorting domain-containing protein [Bacteroidia bacterium]